MDNSAFLQNLANTVVALKAAARQIGCALQARDMVEKQIAELAPKLQALLIGEFSQLTRRDAYHATLEVRPPIGGATLLSDDMGRVDPGCVEYANAVDADLPVPEFEIVVLVPHAFPKGGKYPLRLECVLQGGHWIWMTRQLSYYGTEEEWTPDPEIWPNAISAEVFGKRLLDIYQKTGFLVDRWACQEGSPARESDLEAGSGGKA